MLTAQDFEGLYAIIPTPATADAARPDATDTVDVEETTRLLETLIADGAAGIIALGTTGECATLSDADFRTVVDCVVETVADRVPTFIGATALGTHEVVRRLRYVADRGATGSLLGLPMWQPLTTSMAVRYYREVAETFPELSLMVYANARAFRYTFPSEFWQGIAEQAPTVSAAKVSRGDGLQQLLEVSGRRVHFLPNEMKVHEFHEASPSTTTAAWATAASMGPAPALAILDAVRSGDDAEIERWSKEIAWVHEPIQPLLADPAIFASYNIQIEKARIDEAGYCRPGPSRPPYDDLPDEYDAAARECGRRWRALSERIVVADASSAG